MVAVSIDTEEDDWGSYAEHGASTRNIPHLLELQDLFDRWNARPTYLVNHPPLIRPESVEVLASLSSRQTVEIGAHCHPWNTPPLTGGGAHRSMMCTLTERENGAKLAEIRRRLGSELGVVPRVFRAGRWGFGPTVAQPLLKEGFEVDCSVSPFMDWSAEEGPDYSGAPHRPYRFHPAEPLRPDANGGLLELPTTIGFLSGDHQSRARARQTLERSFLRHVKVVGILDSLGVLAKRWLSPETSSAAIMIRLAEASLSSGQSFLQMTFHSCTLLPGATPFVRTEDDRSRFLRSVNDFLRYCSDSGFEFCTLSEAGQALDSPGSEMT
jgi:hypothetical protein